MHPRLRFWLVTALALVVGVLAATGIAGGHDLTAELTGGALVWLILEWLDGARPEAWVLALALFGYVVGNRGFAQISLSGHLPLLPAEFALAVGIGATFFRACLHQAAAGRRDPLNFAILAWVLLGSGRIWTDLHTNGPMALRDFATVYYALFFFVAQGLASHAPSARLLRRSLLLACALLPVTYLVFTRYANVLLPRLQFRGVPVIYYKEDLVAACLFAGMFLWLTVRTGPAWLRLGVAAVAYGVVFTIASSRAAIVGLLVGCGWWALARRWAPWKLQAVAIPVALGALGLVAMAQENPFHDSRLYALYEEVVSMTDFSGTHHYRSPEREFVGDNNRFRIAWWRSVYDETRAQAPFFGLGFGADLTGPFVRNYHFDLGEDFTTRSPHSILFTVFGRMGLLGLLAFLGIVAAMAARTWRLVGRVRADDDARVALGWWSVAWVLFSSACFGVVLEGPMGAVIFWTALGLANGMTEGEPAAAEASRADHPTLANAETPSNG